jgi:putative NADH-flavin reductase
MTPVRPLRIVVFGATGGLGRQIVAQALAEGHTVTAFARTPDALRIEDARLAVARGNVLDADAVRTAVAGQDVVVSAFGVKPGARPGRLYSDGTRNIVAAMQTDAMQTDAMQTDRQASGAQRLICISTWLVGESRRQAGPLVRIFVPLLGRRLYRDRERQEALVRASGLDWILVRPARLTDGKPTGRYRSGARLKLRVTSHIARADAAAFVLGQVADDTYLRQAATVTY